MLFPQSPAICWVVPGNSGDLPPLILLILTERRTYHQTDHLMGGSSLAGMDLWPSVVFDYAPGPSVIVN